MITQDELRSGLRQFTRIDGWYQHWLNQFVFSDGVKWFCDQADCRWLLTEIAFFQLRIRSDHHHAEPFQIWHLQCLSENRALLECRGGKQSQPFIRDELADIRCALDQITLLLVNGLLLLPSEYLGAGFPLETMV